VAVNALAGARSAATFAPSVADTPPERAAQEFLFLGQLAGMVVRQGLTANLRLAPAVWRSLVGLAQRPRDLARKELRDKLAEVEDMPEPAPSAPAAHAAAELAVLRERAVRAVEVMGAHAPQQARGAAARVTFRNRRVLLAYLRAAAARPGRSGAHAEAFAAGLSVSLPTELLFLFRAEELEELVCGPRDVPVAQLRARCRVDAVGGVAAPDGLETPEVRWLFETLAESTRELRTGFLKCISGSDAWPAAGLAWTVIFVPRSSGELLAKPFQSSTCFHWIKLERGAYGEGDEGRERFARALRNTVLNGSYDGSS